MRHPASLARYVIGVALAVAGGLIVLHIGDLHDPLANPSSLIRLDSSEWLRGTIWWLIAAGVMGLLIAPAMFRVVANEFRTGLSAIALAEAIMVLYLTVQKFQLYSNDFTPLNFGLTYFYNLFAFVIVTMIPGLLATLLAGTAMSIFGQRHSALDIMPPELQKEYLAKQAERRRSPTYRMLHPFERLPEQG